MNRFCYLFDIIPGSEQRYADEHATLWDGVAEAMRDAGVTEYTLFRRGTLVIATGSCNGPVSETFARLERDPVNAAWSAHIRSLMIDPTDDDGRLLFAAEVWQLPGTAQASTSS
ncbi:L-rhamnose mutarotase [Leucobacter aridicollis]|uniref:L-rhamnose mutarotase n=1 Tax=Leucobacter aridicollis TaxID=283878 RepID=A0A852R2A5_9MICO|nr:L-rhamnose mutarotase [Leucobacter aridicollis]MBL3681240.1 L-rhamnose mutarotase [Leucobacter aridicollis]NYD27741.1 L-rhamnose mutarotase [Leucobacter aridicollis]